MKKGTLADLVYPELQTTQRLSFTGENFLFWKLKVPFLLADNQFHDLLEPSSTPTFEEIEGDYGRAVALIHFTLDDFLLSEYSRKYVNYNRHTAKSMLDSLFNRFRNGGSKMVMIMNYKGHRMTADMHINQHIFRMRAMAKELEHVGVILSDELQALMLINSLPEEWEEDVEGLLRDLDSNKKELNFDNVSRRLRIIGDIRKLRDDEKKFKGNCYNCGKRGHYKSDCPKQGSSGNNNSSSNCSMLLDAATLTEMIYPELKTFQKLTSDGSSFYRWKHDLHCVFNDIEIEYVLKDPKPCESTEFASEEDSQIYKKWQTDDFTCRHLILGAMADDLFLSFHDYPTAKALMEAVEVCFNNPSSAMKLTLLKKYINRHMSDDTPTFEHLIKMDLEAFELKIPSEMQSVVLLNSLPESWKEILERLSMQINLENTWKIDDVRSRVRDIGDHKEFSAKLNKASVSRQIPNKKYKKAPKGNCYSCGGPGHYQSDCPDRGDS